ncbi:retrovirus polyprotein [Purpureocillium lavendulum]|uniref:Retrovirus polyprotein n=1 Tax=Purpureocillium lavendulum TaxID=1247861 RepID=A0AB34G2A4_9HYPO|nr:retrovirus polyprotein [Purpureocillium lavendulum]
MTVEKQLPARFEIRVLQPEHLEWAAAIVAHSNLFHSPVWPVIYPELKAKRACEAQKAAHYLVGHQIASGYSLGVFDNEYVFKRPESAATGGALYWDAADEDASGATLLAQMDFPLVSVALAYDSHDKLDKDRMQPLVDVLPVFNTFYRILGARDGRDAAAWEATRRGEVLFRNATSTRHDYEGQGIMGVTARHMMRDTARRGFRGIQIECAADAVTYVWSNPPAPFKGEVVSEFDMATYEEDGPDGRKVNPFYPSRQRATKVYCTLK